MARMNWCRAGWRRWFSAPQPDERQRIVDTLRELYLDEAKDVQQFTEHARRMVYPQVRERLLRIAEEEQVHVSWLADQIRKLGGDLPQPVVPGTPARNLWEYLRMDEDEEKRDEARWVQRINALEPDYPELAEGLRRIRVTEYRHRLALLELQSKANPNGLPVAPIDPDTLDERKRAWLGQQKRAWFAQRKAEWEAGGKQTPWAAWIAERELQWRVNELPNRELQWRLQLAEHGEQGTAVSRM